jgi:predicted AAA+ superfamily ATPase
MWIPRYLEGRLERLGRQRPVIVITGARQTGKTSLARRQFPDHAFVSLDLPSEAELAEREPRLFLSRHPPPLVLDEVQYAPGVFRHIKVLVDAARTENGRFVLTGSQKLALMKEISESLAGRAEIVELEGLSLAEIRGVLPDVTPEMAALRGSLPELWDKPELDVGGFQASYIATYLERDLRSAIAVSSLRDFERLLRACALRSAQLLNKAELARDVGISPSTAAQWISVLEASNQIVLLEPWFSNRTRSLVKTPKLYMGDTGLLCHLLAIRSVDDLLASPYAGAVWETLVFGELRRQIRNGRRSGDLFFWRDRSKEVDFVLHRGGHFELFEAKWTEHPSSRETRQLLRVREDLPPRSVVQSAVVCRTPHRFPLEAQLWALPVGELDPDRS